MIRVRIFLVLSLLCLAGVWITGCGPQTSSSGLNLTNVLPTLPEKSLDYYVERTFKDYSVNPAMIYEERIWHTSNDEYRIESPKIFKEINGEHQIVDAQKTAEFNKLLTGGWGLSIMKRGFRIRDAERFLENYNYTVLSHSEPFLQRNALIVRITSLHQDRPNYTAWIDNKNGFVLKYIEDTLSRNPLTVMEITKLDLKPDFTGISFYQHNIREETATLTEITNLDFNIFNPIYIPGGFYPGTPRKAEVDILFKGNPMTRDVLKITYCDGIQNINVSQSPTLNLHSAQPSFAPQPVNNIHLGNASKAGVHVTRFSVKGTDILIQASIHEKEVIWMIDSLAPLKK